MAIASKLPPLLHERPVGVEAAVLVVVPLVFGAITGFFLGESETVYLVLQLVAAVGAVLGGLEHDHPAEAAYRGLLGGLLFGLAILAVHGLRDAEATTELPDPEVLLLVITGAIGALGAAAGAALRRRLERRGR